ncbi:Pycsar system effector family protein [Frankia sp. R82]|uniref:Pycsar system effector family protein n=1 Tax=Frankia sp. R82 TaxID=2950553 RepID=UPI002043BDE9|nr:Pycsar system effector family protein [Frankia sp. R82]MCM3885554.1 DUF5706 domain-containing protein [Frankia sp. R82]
MAEYARELLEAAREERALADSKASLLLATIGVAISVGTGAVLAGSWTPTRLTPAGAALWWLGAAALTCGVALLAAAVYPRLGPGPSEPWDTTVVNFLEVNRQPSLTDLQDSLRRSAEGDFAGRSRQLRMMSQLAERKYVLIRVALWALLASVVLELAAWLTRGL